MNKENKKVLDGLQEKMIHINSNYHGGDKATKIQELWDGYKVAARERLKASQVALETLKEQIDSEVGIKTKSAKNAIQDSVQKTPEFKKWSKFDELDKAIKQLSRDYLNRAIKYNEEYK